MKALVQRVTHASVIIDDNEHAAIANGLLVLLGIGKEDGPEDIEYLVRKISGLRIFNDDCGLMNRSINDISGEVLVVSQFTLYASTRKGYRPSFVNAAPPKSAKPLYEKFLESLSTLVNNNLTSGVFGANMQVNLLNDGPVTLMIDSQARF